MNQVKKKTKEACGDNYQMARVMREKVGCRDFLGEEKVYCDWTLGFLKVSNRQ